jgi:NADPH-dependent curcumin reductase CurA
MTETAERIVLASRLVGEPTLDNFRLEELPIPQPAPGQMLLRTLWLSLDPYMRGRMSDALSYAKPVGIGEAYRNEMQSELTKRSVLAPCFSRGMDSGAVVASRIGRIWKQHSVGPPCGHVAGCRSALNWLATENSIQPLLVSLDFAT